MTRHEYDSHRVTDDEIIVEVTADVKPKRYPADIYEPTKKKAYSSQQACANAWAQGKLPVHNGGLLYSSPNYQGHQYQSGKGKIVHYSTISDIRTLNGLIITNSEDYGRGWAHEAHPSKKYRPNDYVSLPLTTMDAYNHDVDIYEISRIRDLPAERGDYDKVVIFGEGQDEEAHLASQNSFDDEVLSLHEYRDIMQ